MDFTPGQRQLLAYWGPIQTAVAQRVSTADLWSIVRERAQAEGAALKGVSAIDMGVLRGIAAAQRNAMEAVQRGGADAVITADMIGRDISSRAQQDQNLAPKWLVRFEQDLNVGGQLVTVWRSSFFDQVLPGRTSELRQALEQDAEQMLANSSGGIDATTAVHLGIGRVQINAV